MLNRNTVYRFAIASVGVLLLLAACDDGPASPKAGEIRPPAWIQGTWNFYGAADDKVANIITGSWACSNFRFTADDVICTAKSLSGSIQLLFSGIAGTPTQSVTDTVYTLTFKAGDREEIYRWTLTGAATLNFVGSMRSSVVVQDPQGSFVYVKA